MPQHNEADSHGEKGPMPLAPGLRPLIARPGTEHGSGRGAQRWFAERAFAHLTGSAACGSARIYVTPSTKPSSPSDVLSSAGGVCALYHACCESVSGRQSVVNLHGGEAPADQARSAPVDADHEPVPGCVGQNLLTPGVQRHGLNP